MSPPVVISGLLCFQQERFLTGPCGAVSFVFRMVGRNFNTTNDMKWILTTAEAMKDIDVKSLYMKEEEEVKWQIFSKGSGAAPRSEPAPVDLEISDVAITKEAADCIDFIKMKLTLPVITLHPIKVETNGSLASSS